MIEKQEPVPVIVDPLNNSVYIFCGACKIMLAQNKPKPWKFCPWCGAAVLWPVVEESR